MSEFLFLFYYIACSETPSGKDVISPPFGQLRMLIISVLPVGLSVSPVNSNLFFSPVQLVPSHYKEYSSVPFFKNIS